MTTNTSAPLQPKPTYPSSLPLTVPAIEDVDSARTLTPASTMTKNSHDEKNPFSAFYCHPTTRYSFELQKSESRPTLFVQNIDLEAPHGRQSDDVEQQRKDCEVWPGKHTLRETRKCRRQQGIKGRLQQMNPKSLLALKILIAVLFIGGMLAIGLGVSKAVGGGVWKGEKKSNAQIGDDKPAH